MSYVDSNLMPNEPVIARGRIHWSIYLPGLVVVFLGLLFAFESLTFGGLEFLFGAYALLRAWLRVVAIELAVTDRRVIAKWGLIRRETIELLHSKVESLRVDQSILGRILDFGSIAVHGTGGATTPIPSIAHPLEFRRQALAAIEQSEQRARVA